MILWGFFHKPLILWVTLHGCVHYLHECLCVGILSDLWPWLIGVLKHWPEWIWMRFGRGGFLIISGCSHVMKRSSVTSFLEPLDELEDCFLPSWLGLMVEQYWCWNAVELNWCGIFGQNLSLTYWTMEMIASSGWNLSYLKFQLLTHGISDATEKEIFFHWKLWMIRYAFGIIEILEMQLAVIIQIWIQHMTNTCRSSFK